MEMLRLLNYLTYVIILYLSCYFVFYLEVEESYSVSHLGEKEKGEKLSHIKEVFGLLYLQFIDHRM